MCTFKQIQYHFYRVECFDRDLYESGEPVGHCAVPQARKLEGLEFASLIALGADEAGLWVDVLQEVELLALVVAQAADEVNRVEMRRCGHHLRVGDLHALQNLQGGASVRGADYERTSARLAFVAYHAADAKRPVKLGAKCGCALLA